MWTPHKPPARGKIALPEPEIAHDKVEDWVLTAPKQPWLESTGALGEINHVASLVASRDAVEHLYNRGICRFGSLFGRRQGANRRRSGCRPRNAVAQTCLRYLHPQPVHRLLLHFTGRQQDRLHHAEGRRQDPGLHGYRRRQQGHDEYRPHQGQKPVLRRQQHPVARKFVDCGPARIHGAQDRSLTGAHDRHQDAQNVDPVRRPGELLPHGRRRPDGRKGQGRGRRRRDQHPDRSRPRCV